ncbi:MAG: AIPR family protein [Pseudodesulfovibrio sp.]|nr:AIPR family protein [Pseudomonadota bacterium]MBU4522056.1 AIPR family protein [Pseudomonadota bacterium]MBU4557755.1 AIPR family protein [Pseudomonadota bacterium]MBV1763997.1 AIPR family protein [Pseudodesulfovibrio sp.]MBV1772198.1 AIPR family protein [Pseudodesulfovibrio sp.]
MMKASRQDFSLINTRLKQLMEIHDIEHFQNAFYYLVLELLFDLQDDEIDNAVTDSFYLSMASNNASGHDRGIDAIYIDDNSAPPIVHLLNFKYTSKFDNLLSHYPSREIDKVLSFFHDLMSEGMDSFENANSALRDKINDIWKLMDSDTPSFRIHFCSNSYNAFEESEKKRIDSKICNYSNTSVEYHLMPDLVEIMTHKSKTIISGKIKAIDKKFFEKSEGDIRALILEVDAKDLLRIVCDDEGLRNDAALEDYEVLKTRKILEEAFEDNVRVYLTQRSKINKNIRKTALSESSHRFFYFNNGITITCRKFSYPNYRAPIVTLEDAQVVNGSQTIHALFEAFLKDSSKFDHIQVLCRIYETTNAVLSSEIAENTNSQNPVKSRDIRSNDYVQKKLEVELLSKGFYYERKRGQHRDKKGGVRIDAEKAGQALMSFYNKLPAEAKDKKRLIFAEKYEDVFCDSITSEEIVLSYTCYQFVEKMKKKWRREAISTGEFDQKSYLMHASYYILSLMRVLAEGDGVDIRSSDHVRTIEACYEKAARIVEKAVEKEVDRVKNTGETYSNRLFFKSARPKKYISQLIDDKYEF